MVKVITYGTYDLLHYGHIRLLQRAKALGDYLIVGVTAEDFDRKRGKINVQQSLMERIDAVRATGIADEIIVEEYEGQKIDDIKKYDIDIFTEGSDWIGQFDYLEEYCKVVYLERTDGISSSDLRKEHRHIKLGLVGDAAFLSKVLEESKFVNGLKVNAVYSRYAKVADQVECSANSFDELLETVDAVYIRSKPIEHYSQIKKAIYAGKHVLCESPVTLKAEHTRELYALAEKNHVVLMEAIKTAYSTAFSRLILLLKGGKIGKIATVDATCTSLENNCSDWGGIHEWAPTALLPVFQILGTEIDDYKIALHSEADRGEFAKIDVWFKDAAASVKAGNIVKSEGELIISGSKGYVYVPSPWWKTDYFEIRYEDQSQNERYFYQLEGEGIRYELVAFVRSIEKSKADSNINQDVSRAISHIMEGIYTDNNVIHF